MQPELRMPNQHDGNLGRQARAADFVHPLGFGNRVSAFVIRHWLPGRPGFFSIGHAFLE
jgi:hypothetical protein